VAQKNKKEELKKLHDEIEKKEEKLKEVEKRIEEEKLKEVEKRIEEEKLKEVEKRIEEEKDGESIIPDRITGRSVSIKNECELLIKKYKKKSRMSDHNIKLLDDLIDAYVEFGSLSKVCQETDLDIRTIRNDFRNLLRVPEKLRNDVNESRLIADPILAVEIALHATDYFSWDQNETNTPEVLLLAKNMAEMFNNNLNLRKEFFATKDDYDKPVSKSTKKNKELKEILEDWPVKESKYEFNRITDRSGRQYKLIVLYSKAIEAARFLRRWEYEKGRRISKKWAHEMIEEIQSTGDAKEFVKNHSDEFRD